MGKGYKLTSAAGGGPKTCAFYFSEKGCRNEATCKFSHEAPAAAAASASPPSVASSSVVSSESESDGEIVEDRAGAYASLAKGEVVVRNPTQQQVPACINPFLASVTAPPVAEAAVKSPAAEPSTAEKKKKRKKKQQPTVAPGESIFDLGNAEDQKSPSTPSNSAAAAATPPAKKAKQQKAVAAPQNSQKQHPPQANATQPPSFRNLQLPVASFSLPITTASSPAPKSPRPPSPQHEPAPTPPPLPLPTATPAHLKWKDAVIATRGHANYANSFNYDRAQQYEVANGVSSPEDWITTRPYGQWCASNPASIAIDCEMCQTKDPDTGRSDNKALCRISVVNADNPSEVLLDTLVKPDWPVSDYRTWVNGIAAKDLENVQFTFKHAQMFMSALCSEQTIVVGHSVHNDLLALRMVHHCNVDTALLYTHVDADDGTPSLKNLAKGVMGKEMPDVHDSVNDARVALECAQNYVDKSGKVEPVEKVYIRKRSFNGKRDESASADEAVLLVHRLPSGTKSEHISEMFLAYTCIRPKNVPDITFSGPHGKCHVEFSTRDHADLAYASLSGDESADKTGKKQKRVGLKGGGYVRVRKMIK